MSEEHPEIGPNGNGLVSYTYNASGNVLSKDIAGSSDFSLRYRYDAANRLLGVDEVTGANPETVRRLKEFQYARANNGSDLRQGKLVLSKRINWVDPVPPLEGLTGTLPVTISQAYRYQGLDGRVSERQTRYQLGLGHFAFSTGFEYDPLGRVSSLSYPRCLHYGCAGRDPERTVGFTYQRGFLTSVGGFATSLTYQLGGMLHQVAPETGQ